MTTVRGEGWGQDAVVAWSGGGAMERWPGRIRRGMEEGEWERGGDTREEAGGDERGGCCGRGGGFRRDGGWRTSPGREKARAC